MELTRGEERGLVFVEAAPGGVGMARPRDVDRVVEACLAERARAALLPADALPPGFFDLSTGAAGEVLQKARTYRIRLAVVRPPDGPALSRRFPELLADEAHGRDFGLFETRAAALEWLARGA